MLRRYAASIAIVALCAPLLPTETLALPAIPNINTSQKLKTIRHFETHEKCAINKANYGYICSVKEIEDDLKDLQNEYTQVVSNFQNLISSNVELLCVDLENLKRLAIVEIGDPENWIERDQKYGPCGDGSYPYYGVNRDALFPCSNPNTKFEQTYPREYWSIYYDWVKGRGNACSYYFNENYPFWKLWVNRWSLIWDKYQDVAIDFIWLAKFIEYGLGQLEIAKSMPFHKFGDCYRDKNDLSKGMLPNRKTEADKFGYKFTCRNSVMTRTGRVLFTATSMSCPNTNYPTGNNCTVYTSWGTSAKLYEFPKSKPVGKVVDNGSFISLTGYSCTLKLYKNFAYVESCR